MLIFWSAFLDHKLLYAYFFAPQQAFLAAQQPFLAAQQPFFALQHPFLEYEAQPFAPQQPLLAQPAVAATMVAAVKTMASFFDKFIVDPLNVKSQKTQM